MKKILFVCTGNTCRSPMAESILKHKLKEKGAEGIRCSSAGIYAETGAPMSPNAKKALRTMKVKPRTAKSKPVTAALLGKYNLVLCMTDAHRESLVKYGHKNLFTLAEFTNTSDIPDPFGGDLDTYLASAKQIEKAVDILIETF